MVMKLSHIQLRIHMCLLFYSSIHVNMFLELFPRDQKENIYSSTLKVCRNVPISNYKGSHPIKQ